MKWTLQNISILVGLILLVLYLFSSYPRINVDYCYGINYLNGQCTSWIPSYFNLSLYTNSSFQQNSQICFRFYNSGQNLPSSVIQANNMKVLVKTNAICDSCSSTININELDAQKESTFCKSVVSYPQLSNLIISVISSYDAIWHHDEEVDFSCQNVTSTPTQITYFCKIL